MSVLHNRAHVQSASAVDYGTVARESAYGSDPAKGEVPTAYERFERLTREIVTVPKAEVDKRREKAKRPRKRARSRTP